MRIVSLNCCWQKKGFTDEKRKEILRFNPDILIVQECKQEDWKKLNYTDKKGHWYGDDKDSQGDPNKILGIGIFCNNDFSIDCSLFENQDISNMRYALPYKIKYKDEEILTLFSVWTKSGYENYHIPILNSLEYFYSKTKSPIVLAGDFNTGSTRDNLHWYEELKTKLEKYGLKNCAVNSEYEFEPTFFHDKTNNYFTNDFCFIPKNLNINEFYVDKMNNEKSWRGLSDHCPIIADFQTMP